MVSNVRTDPHWCKHVQQVGLSFAPTISFPCAGIDGPARACVEAQWPVNPAKVIDVQKSLLKPLQYLHGPEAPASRTSQ